MRFATTTGMAIAIVMFTALFSSAQADHPKATPELDGIAHVALRVADLQASRNFYKKLGYEEAFALDSGGAPTEAFFKVNDRQFIELYPKHKTDEQVGFMHVCFESRDLPVLHDAYEARGLSPTPVKKAGAGNLLFTMRGPENQNIEYTQYMPGSRHTLDIGKHLGPHRIAGSIVGLGIPMADVNAASDFYKNKLGFIPLRHAFDSGSSAFRLPGTSMAEIEIRKEMFHLLLNVEDLSAASSELSARGVAYKRDRRSIAIHDPDGNAIVLIHKALDSAGKR